MSSARPSVIQPLLDLAIDPSPTSGAVTLRPFPVAELATPARRSPEAEPEWFRALRGVED